MDHGLGLRLGHPICWYCWWFRNPAFTSWYGKYTIIYRVLAPSQVVWDFFHQQYQLQIPCVQKDNVNTPLESTCPSIYSLNEANVQNSNTSFIFSVFSIHIWSILVKPVGKNSLKWGYVRCVPIPVTIATRITNCFASTKIKKNKIFFFRDFHRGRENTFPKNTPLYPSDFLLFIPFFGACISCDV